MLYKLTGNGEDLGTLEPIPFLGVADIRKREKHLENLLAEHLLEVLFEDVFFLPIFQERQRQAEADIYAVDKRGDLVIFEVKRGTAGEDAVLQVIRYAQDAGRWQFADLERKFATYLESQGLRSRPLQEAHKEAFQLDTSLSTSEFNRNQLLYVVGSAADDDLSSAVDYWKNCGLSIEFVPYRIYQIGKDRYFEFFSLPYDRHRNPSDAKGVLFDTNQSWNENAIWEMMEKCRVAAYGNIKECVVYLNPKDIVFFYHRGVGIVAAGEVLNGRVKYDGQNEAYRDVKFLTQRPRREDGISRSMPASEVERILGHRFFWAKTLKVPRLSPDESQQLLKVLNDTVGKGTE